MKFKEVTDPEILKQLNADFVPPKKREFKVGDKVRISDFKPVTDPELLKELNASLKKPEEKSFLQKLIPNLTVGVLEGRHNIINTPYKVAKGMGKNSLAAKFGLNPENVPHEAERDYAKDFNLGEPTLMDKWLRGTGEFAGAFVLPEAELGAIGSAISKIPKLGNYLNKSARIGVPQAAYGATQDEDISRGALMGGATGLVAPALEGVFNALRPSVRLRGNLSADELKANLEAAEGTNTGLGRIVESPRLMKLQENHLPPIIGSGAESTMQKTADQVSARGENLLEKIRNNLNPSNLSVQLQKALKAAAGNATKEKNVGYEKLNKLADEQGFLVGRNNFQDAANKTLEDIELSPELKAEFTADLYKDLIRYANNSEGNNLKLTNIFRGKLGDKANELYQAGKMHEYGIVKSLKDALTQDIEESFAKNGSSKLKALYEKNQKDYAEKFAHFDDPDIVKFTRKGGDPDLILPHFLRGGKNDRATILNKVLEGSQLKQQGLPSLLTYSYFSKAVDENGLFNPIKFAALYSKLGNNQRKALIPDEKMRNELKKFNTLVGMNKESFDLMRNPKTGYRNTDMLVKLVQAALGSPGGIPGMVASVAGTGAAANVANKLLTSPRIRKSLIQKMIDNKESKIPGRIQGSALLNALINGNGE